MHAPSCSIAVRGLDIPVYQYNTIVVGSGAAGLNAACFLRRNGNASVAIVTEGMDMGTSRNTGSDKQTYYKLSTCGDQADSVRMMASALFEGGAMDGDIALAEAALSARCFFRLVEAGVPFPHNAHGEYVGYKTDHDPCRRGTSAGPLTSKYMTECLEREVAACGIPVFDRHQVVEILTTGGGGQKTAIGALALNLDRLDDPARRYAVFSAKNILYATGGEAGMYEASVYPESQSGGTGVALRAGVAGKNLTESQFGIASVAFRWNLSGTYQQVLPRYVSTDADGNDEREFLDKHFDGPQALLDAIFLKGYQWPFDPRKVEHGGSSLIDILVYHERVNLGRRVFLDYRRNPSRCECDGGLDPNLLGGEAGEYLRKSGALLPTPLERLETMNPAAIALYRDHGIDLRGAPLEIAVCAQHNNGGLAGDSWWQSDVRHFFPIGEANGSHGVYRPGGSALNSGQVGGVRAGTYVLRRCGGPPLGGEQLANACMAQLESAVGYGENALRRGGGTIDLAGEIASLRRRMSVHGAHVRSREGAAKALAEARGQLRRIEDRASADSPAELGLLHKARDLAVCQYAYLFAIDDYIAGGGGSRGSYLVADPRGIRPGVGLPENLSFRLDDGGRRGKIQEVRFDGDGCAARWRPVRPLPPADDWFERVWKRHADGDVYDSPNDVSR